MSPYVFRPEGCHSFLPGVLYPWFPRSLPEILPDHLAIRQPENKC